MKKKLITFTAGSLSFLAARAQNNTEPLVDRSLIFGLVNICGTILALYVICWFIIRLVQQYLDSKLKNRIVDAGTLDTTVAQLLQKKQVDNRKTVLQWICVLAPLAIALFIIDAMGRVTLTSLAILAAGIAIGLLVYYLLTKKQP